MHRHARCWMTTALFAFAAACGGGGGETIDNPGIGSGGGTDAGTDSVAGSGGKTGSGGQTGSGGTAGSVLTGSGGKAGSGGVSGSGGKAGSGGVTGSGGKAGSGGVTGSGGSGSGGAGACEFPDPPSNVAAWVNESWAAQLTSNIKSRKAWLLDQAIKGQGQINVCVRWSTTQNATLTKAVHDQIEPTMAKWFNDWFKAIGNYGCFPYPNGVTVKVTGYAVRPGTESVLSSDWNDGSVPVYTEVDPGSDPANEPKCPDACSFFEQNPGWTHSFPSCNPGGSFEKGDKWHFDYSLWIGDTLPGGAGAVGGDWGLRIARSTIINRFNGQAFMIAEHEIGHGFGLQDYYDWTGSTPTGGSIMIVGSTSAQSPTTGDMWLIRRVWKEQKALRGW